MSYYKIVLPSVDADSLSRFEQRLYKASHMGHDGYKIRATEDRYSWEIITSLGKRYSVKWHPDGIFTCNCLDAHFRASKDADGWCKHMFFVLVSINISEIMAVVLLVNPFLVKYLQKI